MTRKRVSKSDASKIASERISILLSRSRMETLNGREDRARRYVSLARRIGRRTQTSAKGEYCKECNSYLIPGVNCRVRMTGGRRSITCLGCGNIKRIPFTKEQP